MLLKFYQTEWGIKLEGFYGSLVCSPLQEQEINGKKVVFLQIWDESNGPAGVILGYKEFVKKEKDGAISLEIEPLREEKMKVIKFLENELEGPIQLW